MFNLSGTKELRLSDGSIITYELIKKSRRTIGLKITPKGLVVYSPLLITKNMIDQLLQNKSKWIQKKLLLTITDEAPFEIKNGERFNLFDKEIIITLTEGVSNISIEKSRCVISFIDLSNHLKLKKFFLSWINKYALIHFSQRVESLCKNNNLKVQTVLTSNAKTRWGTCNSRKEIRLNWRLIQSPPFVIDYVICHELSHLKFMNHSKDFWNEVQLLSPNYRKAEQYLKENGFKLYRLD